MNLLPDSLTTSYHTSSTGSVSGKREISSRVDKSSQGRGVEQERATRERATRGRATSERAAPSIYDCPTSIEPHHQLTQPRRQTEEREGQREGGRQGERESERARAFDKSTRALPRDAPRVSHERQPRSYFYYIKIQLTPNIKLKAPSAYFRVARVCWTLSSYCFALGLSASQCLARRRSSLRPYAASAFKLEAFLWTIHP